MKFSYFLFLLMFTYLISLNLVFAGISDDDFSTKLLNLTSIDDPLERFSEIENLYKVSDEYKKYLLLPFAAKYAVIIAKYDRAKYFATELLKLSDKYQDGWNYGNAIHDGNIVLGMIALKTGNVEGAKSYLIIAGKTSGSPQLLSFGPEMMLAYALLIKDERDVVIKYLELCKKFWKKDSGRISSWIASINGSGMPYFGANLTKLKNLKK